VKDPIQAVLAGERLAISRLITQVENDTPVGRTALNALFPHAGRAHLVGVTGSPGTGKSSLVNQLARVFRRPSDGAPSLKVGVVAVDPSSPFTGGALLGDRVRMRDLAGDPGVFIRSMASRGALGGLARTTAAVVQVLDAAGFDIILIETVGAGQSEVDIARLAHTTIVVEAPGLGDDIQAIKAGILEIADILVINKGDRVGVENTERALRSMLELAHPERARCENCGDDDTPLPDGQNGEPELWIPPILRTIAPQTQGIAEVVQAIYDHGAYLKRTGLWRQRERERLQTEMNLLLRDTLMTRWRESVSEGEIRETLAALSSRRISPQQAVERLLENRESMPSSG